MISKMPICEMLVHYERRVETKTAYFYLHEKLFDVSTVTTKLPVKFKCQEKKEKRKREIREIINKDHILIESTFNNRVKMCANFSSNVPIIEIIDRHNFFKFH